MFSIFNENITIKDKTIPETILGYAPLIAEAHFGHRSRLYELDLSRNPENIAKVIIEAYNNGARAINLVNNENLLKGFDIAIENGCDMKVIATIGKSDVDYRMPNYEVAKEVDWEDDIELFLKYGTSAMLVDEFIVDGYDWDLTAEILSKINETGAVSGIITSFPFRTTEELKDNLDTSLFDLYMVPINKVAYMMDCPDLLEEHRIKLKETLESLDKIIIASRIFATGILQPKEAFEFINSLNYVSGITFGVASEKEASDDFSILNEL